ncbi:hypothetical protein [Bordetella avium]|uniref:Uncharacterized protein n=1 Tax=Bordetella avium (strain 197N) TaxID=360910 RepID=Q2KV40_BORA1|nr:hypothetical protein [Bordetella avium]AZY50298.1 hypothetical protein C0J09_15085 [Bordetella avium]AZY53692.1 hypothetical protein C0J07_15335 [Bordetella avium]RIQ15534.1 hypothetical protein D0432_05335 [Bordetella avium]RIQ19660.1 hypothetical protein D0850_00275 [Bordetella avium]RIQ34240.1 hypothetical protein D0849_06255 [Bordetella avium]
MQYEQTSLPEGARLRHYEVPGSGGVDVRALIKALQSSRSVALGLGSLLAILQQDLSSRQDAPSVGKAMDPAQADALFELARAALDLLNDKLECVADSLAIKRDQPEQESI